MMTTEVKTLYSLVTDAIRKAEVLDDLSAPGRREAWLDVSLLEERIASLFPASCNEGAIARRGAVSAAVDAGEFERAERLAACFAMEAETDDELKKDLRDLTDQASSAIAGQTVSTVASDTSQDPAFFIILEGKNNAGQKGRMFSSLDEVRKALLASKDIEAARVEVYLKAGSPTEFRNAVDKAFPVASRRPPRSTTTTTA